MAAKVTAQAAPLPPNPGGKSIRLPQNWGQGGTPGAIETILTAWLSSCDWQQLRLGMPFDVIAT